MIDSRLPPVTLIVTRHAALRALLIERDLATRQTPWIEIVYDPLRLRGEHVAGALPLRLARLCASVTEIEMDLPLADRQSVAGLPLDALRKIAGHARRYVVAEEE